MLIVTLIQILLMLLNVLWWIIIIQAVLSWLVVFNVINTQSDFMRSVFYALDRLTEPLYRPIRRVLPDFGGLDFSPIVVLLIIKALQIVLSNIALSAITAQ